MEGMSALIRDTIELCIHSRQLYMETLYLLVIGTIAISLTLSFTSLNGEKTKKNSSKVLFVSYQIVSLLTTSYSAYLGWYGWLYDRGNVDNDHMYGESLTAVTLGHVMTGYQIWNLVMCLFINEYKTVLFLGHHITTAILSYSIPRPFVNYYGLFFIGIAETSNTPLTLMDVSNYSYLISYEQQANYYVEN